MWKRVHVKFPLVLLDFNDTWIFRHIFENPQISNFVKICPVGAEFFHADGHDGANSRFAKFCERG